MTTLATRALRPRGAAALAAVAALVLIPALWTAWSLHAAGLVAATVREQSAVLAGLKKRIASLAASGESAGAAEGAFLPGGTAAVAGAALQALVAEKVGAAGGRLVESEFAPVAVAEEDPGRVDLRVSFETDIVGLQRILYDLESGAPILLVRSLTVQSPGATELAAMANPLLRVDMLVGGYWEAAE